MNKQGIEIPLVVNADDMDDEDFIQHFINRHKDQMPGLSDFTYAARKDEELMETYRKFHDKLHEFYLLTNPHEHEKDWE